MMGGAIGVAFMVIYFVPLAGLWSVAEPRSTPSRRGIGGTWGYAMGHCISFSHLCFYSCHSQNSILSCRLQSRSTPGSTVGSERAGVGACLNPVT